MRISDWSSDVCSSDLVVHRPCDLADAFEAFEIALVGHAEQLLVEKALHRRQHDLAVSVVLDLLIGGVADPHRSHAAITGEMFGDTLAQLGDTHHRIDRPELPARRPTAEIAQVSEIFLEHTERA